MNGFKKVLPLEHEPLKANVRTSGLRKPSGPWHWHFILCGPRYKEAELLRLASLLWRRFFGNEHFVPFDKDRFGARYLAKTASLLEFEYSFANLDRFPKVTLDLFEHQQTDPYVPDHVRDRLAGQTLVMRSAA